MPSPHISCLASDGLNPDASAMQLLEFEKPAVELERELEKLRTKSSAQNIDMSEEISMMEVKLADTRARIYENLTPWQRVQIARHTSRPFMLDYVSLSFTDFCELHGDLTTTPRSH